MTPISLVLILVNFLVSWKGFRDRSFYERYSFNIEKVLVYKEYYRLITSGFLHVGWGHLIWNMISLYAFSSSVESSLGPLQFLLIYFTALVGGDLLSLFIHRHHGEYSSVGASAGVCGIIFASIAVFPGMSVGFILLPIAIPGWVYGLAYVLISIYGIRSKNENVGHDAHLGGAMIGMMVALLFRPEAFTYNLPTILLISVPCIVFMYIIATKPHVLLVDSSFSRNQRRYYSIDHRYNAQKVEEQMEIDRILDKIGKSGMSSLTRKEKEALERHSRTVK